MQNITKPASLGKRADISDVLKCISASESMPTLHSISKSLGVNYADLELLYQNEAARTRIISTLISKANSLHRDAFLKCLPLAIPNFPPLPIGIIYSRLEKIALAQPQGTRLSYLNDGGLHYVPDSILHGLHKWQEEKRQPAAVQQATARQAEMQQPAAVAQEKAPIHSPAPQTAPPPPVQPQEAPSIAAPQAQKPVQFQPSTSAMAQPQPNPSARDLPKRAGVLSSGQALDEILNIISRHKGPCFSFEEISKKAGKSKSYLAVFLGTHKGMRPTVESAILARTNELKEIGRPIGVYNARRARELRKVLHAISLHKGPLFSLPEISVAMGKDPDSITRMLRRLDKLDGFEQAKTQVSQAISKRKKILKAQGALLPSRAERLSPQVAYARIVRTLRSCKFALGKGLGRGQTISLGQISRAMGCNSLYVESFLQRNEQYRKPLLEEISARASQIRSELEPNGSILLVLGQISNYCANEPLTQTILSKLLGKNHNYVNTLLRQHKEYRASVLGAISSKNAQLGFASQLPAPSAQKAAASAPLPPLAPLNEHTAKKPAAKKVRACPIIRAIPIHEPPMLLSTAQPAAAGMPSPSSGQFLQDVLALASRCDYVPCPSSLVYSLDVSESHLRRLFSSPPKELQEAVAKRVATMPNYKFFKDLDNIICAAPPWLAQLIDARLHKIISQEYDFCERIPCGAEIACALGTSPSVVCWFFRRHPEIEHDREISSRNAGASRVSAQMEGAVRHRHQRSTFSGPPSANPALRNFSVPTPPKIAR